ncbi:hypothetical protein DFP72DRAFT_811373, partial [Ephemerocybe angulata]
VTFLRDLKKWDAYGHPIICAILTWIGDCLVIYRCFLIWKRNYYVIALPVLLLLTSIGVCSINLYWFRHPTSLPWSIMEPLFTLTFPLNFIQNVLTTGCIAYKIYMQHRLSRSTGISLTVGLNLITILRVIVESALIYTIETFLLIILYFTRHPAEVIVEHAMVPSLGIVFVLIAVRAHVAKKSLSAYNTQTSGSIVPTWLSGDEDGTDGRRDAGHIRSNQRRSGVMPVINVTTTTEQHRMDVLHSPRGSGKYPTIVEFDDEAGIQHDVKHGGCV